MNKVALKKLLKAKQLEYEAVKEIMPEAMRAHVELAEEEVLNFIKEMAWAMLYKDDDRERESTERNINKGNNKLHYSVKEKQDQTDKENKQTTESINRSKKIEIDFSEG